MRGSVGGLVGWPGVGVLWRCPVGLGWGVAPESPPPFQANEGTLRKPRSDLSILLNCARMAEETLDDERLLCIAFTNEQVQTCIKDLKKWADDFAQWLEQRKE